MYATLSYDVTAGQTPVDAVRHAVLTLFVDRRTCDLLSDTFIAEVDSAADFADVHDRLREMGNSYGGQLTYVFTLHRTGSPLRSNASFPKGKARRIVEGEDA